MITRRRYATYAASAILTLLFIWHFQDGLTSRIRHDSTFQLPKKHTDGRFHWDNVPVHFPVREVQPIPSTKPKKLPKVQFDFAIETAEHAAIRRKRQDAVKATFERCWKSYRRHAWMHDELTPIHAGYGQGFGGWAATLVDNLDTLWIMGLNDEFEEAVTASLDIDLGTSTTETVNVFETTIRHLGGFLAAYDLSGDKRLLARAKDFGEMLLKAFDTPNRMPITRWKPQAALNGPQEADPVVLVAEIGSLTMEFTHLSQVTGDMRWYDATHRIMKLFAAQQDDTHLPGMFPVSVNGRDSDFTADTFFTLGAMSDSLYEYFPKMHALLGGVDEMYSKLYAKSMKTAIKYNLWKPMTPENADILMSGSVRVEMGSPPQLEAQGQHLVCFAGGMFALGGKLFQQPDHLEIAQKLTQGCIYTYRALPMGIMPEIFSMTPCDSKDSPCPWDETKWRAEIASTIDSDPDLTPSIDDVIAHHRLPKGFTSIGDRRYILRPEAIESVFILYRTTGDPSLLDAAWEMFQSIVNATTTPLGNAALEDVTFSQAELDEQGRDVRMDSMESFWTAETLKYFYLIFSEPDVVSLDQWVFNTEAHAFRRAGT
ncbi:glycoside hydrolase family 47 protein [Zymoseptoria brevis]|uniref:alpha-1,2-Mannosidase n=1 Tax=Zymoseptoria brevis TaxID=1047168 RepID=A0A0F4GW07_9PEZI|nr:glycoside hydrolase family 47 protein [Zymoseptoria brevis]